MPVTLTPEQQAALDVYEHATEQVTTTRAALVAANGDVRDAQAKQTEAQWANVSAMSAQGNAAMHLIDLLVPAKSPETPAAAPKK